MIRDDSTGTTALLSFFVILPDVCFPPRGGALTQSRAPPVYENLSETGKFALLFFCAYSN